MPGLSRSQNQPLRRATTNTEDVDDEDSFDDTQEQDDDQAAHSGTSNIDQMGKKLVRLALACEYNRRPLRRTEISDKVLGTASRQFRKVFAQAQQELRTVFGMDLIELPSKEKSTVAEKRAAKQKEKATTTTNQWVLISILPSVYHDPAIIPPPAAPDSVEDSKYTAIYTTLVSLIALNRGSLPDSKLERYLARLGLEDRTPIEGYDKTEKLIKRLERDGYIVKVREAVGPGGEEEISWVVGPRGKIEIGDAGVKGLVEAVYGGPEGSSGVELATKISRSLGQAEKKQKQTAEAAAASQKRTRKRKSRQDEDEAMIDDDEDDEHDDDDD